MFFCKPLSFKVCLVRNCVLCIYMYVCFYLRTYFLTRVTSSSKTKSTGRKMHCEETPIHNPNHSASMSCLGPWEYYANFQLIPIAVSYRHTCMQTYRHYNIPAYVVGMDNDCYSAYEVMTSIQDNVR